MKKWVHILLTLWTVLLLSVIVVDAQTSEKRIITYARKIRASKLDPSLPNKSVEAWLRSVVGSKAEMFWESNDCGEGTGSGSDRDRNLPACAEVTAKLSDGRIVGIRIIVGTYRKGIIGAPAFHYAYIASGEEHEPINELRNLPALLRKSPTG